ncbi:DUF2933 domain-containing protein [Variovorax sp. SRS16]|uniref:DUF2933 domain-containing protein n=1 Tax=Variovorax sp. SRS16 TaxID=282217 RepID=UPI0013A53236|nr:DUF2933 domain-containing protein [Variovorax sp. SRS16]
MKTVVKLLIGLGVGFVVAYIALPAARAFILSISPLLLVLVCPLAMGGMMLAMKEGKPDEKPHAQPPASSGLDQEKL